MDSAGMNHPKVSRPNHWVRSEKSKELRVARSGLPLQFTVKSTGFSAVFFHGSPAPSFASGANLLSARNRVSYPPEFHTGASTPEHQQLKSRDRSGQHYWPF
ncbi:hypothetical protein ALUC_10502S [Aspergillus luchuensis]|nr:hypothetical protein ALUC_10502S [Aspergillus luchuensis]